jgi:hypothetical protein
MTNQTQHLENTPTVKLGNFSRLIPLVHCLFNETKPKAVAWTCRVVVQRRRMDKRTHFKSASIHHKGLDIKHI